LRIDEVLYSISNDELVSVAIADPSTEYSRVDLSDGEEPPPPNFIVLPA